ncbi:hypothetical protein [Lactiplantibacillus mudanjiangensis]|uniref:Uncharacterized protein n=1 Tax=Lactiplantibacillus mudanjiangensis TaxID=1296538 RepID=A0A660E9B6_9LACO|nr:hypothetical protein [Lactiplantibacillus mudanjiangensis]VDG25715.1 hypothetical protein MUDAN_IGPPGNFN_03390 [Lactiplantibacillus mudanjiangensis]VDG29741.1 hypothetical protein MUDAN_MDHGFNIF_01278 [Lactiplantibacillus mudanjiangensis]
MSKKWLAGLAVGTALTGAGAVVGVVSDQVSQPVTAQAATKMKKVVIKKLIWKDGKWHDFKVTLPYGKTTAVKTPKYKGYKDMEDSTIGAITVFKDGSVGYGTNPFVFMKVISAKQQAKNAKSKKAVTAKGSLAYYTTSNLHEKYVKYTVKGLVGTMVKIKAPKVKGYKSKTKTINIGIMGKNKGWNYNMYHYVKK